MHTAAPAMDLDQLGSHFGARQMRNCLPCKKRKIKCDRRIPCGPCALRRDGKSCTPAVSKMDDVIDEPDAYVLSRDFKMLVRHVEELQSKVEALEGRILPDGAGPSSGKRKALDHKGESSESPPLIGRSRKHVADDEMVFALEDFQMSHRINSLRNLGDSPETGPLHLPGAMGTRSHRFVADDHPLSFLIPPETDYVAKALALLPDQPTCELLVQAYFDNVEWFQRCLHQPTFMRQARLLYNDTRDATAEFVCTYIMVICLGLRTVVNSLPGMTNALGLADRLYHVAEGVLWCSRFLTRHSFEALQAISLMTIYGFGLEDGADGTWALCGTAIKIAQNLGLNRLEAEGPDQEWAPLWNSRLKRELARRVWWTFVALDWSHAIAHGASYSIHPSQNTTALPSNLDDDQLDNPKAVPHPLSVYTPISMHIFRLKFVTLYREITDHMSTSHQPLSYSFILSMDDSIIELANSLPKHFEDPADLPPDTDSSLLRDSIFLNITANTRLVRLHRPFLLRGYHDRQYARSRDRCLRSSNLILSLLELAKRRVPVLLTFWIVLFYAFSAAIPVCIDLLFDPTDEKRRAVETILQTFREQSATSHAARNSVFVIERLLEVESTFREAHLAKRAKMGAGGGESGPHDAARQNELLKSTIRSILESTTFSRPPEAGKMPQALDVAVETAPHPAIPRVFDHLTPLVDLGTVETTPSTTAGADNIASEAAAWPAFSFDMFDTLWTQADATPWQGQ